MYCQGGRYTYAVYGALSQEKNDFLAIRTYIKIMARYGKMRGHEFKFRSLSFPVCIYDRGLATKVDKVTPPQKKIFF